MVGHLNTARNICTLYLEYITPSLCDIDIEPYEVNPTAAGTLAPEIQFQKITQNEQIFIQVTFLILT